MIINNENFKLVGILGNPLKQSMSPILHNYWITKYNLNAVYLPFPINNIKKLNDAIKTFNIKGLNVTIPYKKEVVKHLDFIEGKAKKIGAVNTISYKNNKVKGYNTDIEGFGSSLKKKKWNKKRPVFIYGAGGAAEAVIAFAKQSGCKDITIINRTAKKAEKIANKYKGIKIANGEKVNLKEAGLIVNSTSLGMITYPKLCINIKGINREAIIYDVVYNPVETLLIKKAIKEKLNYITGLDMFLEQAKRSFEIWFNIKPAINKKLIELINKKIKKK